MAYSEDLRERVIAYLEEGHSQEETRIIYKVGVSTIKRWLALLSETGSLEKRSLDRSPRKFISDKLNTYIEENPNALLKDVAHQFGGTATGAFHALNREKITLKKRLYTTRKETRQNVSSSRLN